MVYVYMYMTFLFCCLLGAALPPEKEKTEHFDSNCITPVSERLQGMAFSDSQSIFCLVLQRRVKP